MHKVILGHGSEYHNGQYNNIRLTKTGCIIIKMKYVTTTPISPEDYFRNKVQKGNKQLLHDKLSELTQVCQNTKQ